MKILILLAACAIAAPAAVTVQKTAYKGWPNCYRIANGEVELVVTSDVGPRIIRFGFIGGQNIFKEFPDQLGKTGESQFQLRGGHRVWKALEDPVGSWAPDNAPVQIELLAHGLTAREPIEPLTKLQKEIEIHLAPTGTEVTGDPSHREPLAVPAGIFGVGDEYDGAKRHRNYGLPAAWQTSHRSWSYQSSGNVGLH